MHCLQLLHELLSWKVRIKEKLQQQYVDTLIVLYTSTLNHIMIAIEFMGYDYINTRRLPNK